MPEIKCRGCEDVFEDTPENRTMLDDHGWRCLDCGGEVIFWPEWSGSRGLEHICTERQRQVQEEGWSPEHDAGHEDGAIAWAAVCYAAPGTVLVPATHHPHAYVDPWPWDRRWDKRKTVRKEIPMSIGTRRRERVKELAKAGALAAAEIDRILALPEPLDPLIR